MIGTMDLTYTKKRGSFYCPNCTTQRDYAHKITRQFLTVYFIPLIPLQMQTEFLLCATCKQQFELSVADMDAEQIKQLQREAIFELIRRVLVVIVAADNMVTDEELETVRDFARRYQQADVTPEQLLREAAMVRDSGMDTVAYIRHIAGQLSGEDKVLLVEYAFLAATAGGELTESRQDLLKQMPAAIGMSEPDFREIIVRAAER